MNWKETLIRTIPIVCILGCLGCGIALWYPIYVAKKPPVIVRESMQIIPATNRHAVTTNVYSGGIEITISGYLTSPDGSETIDAYYVLNSTGEYEAVEEGSILRINDYIALPRYLAGNAPQYADNHTYTFQHSIGYENKPIEFIIEPAELANYAGNLQVDIVTVPNYGGR